jgi:alkylhydroperoxidase family enzyme
VTAGKEAVYSNRQKLEIFNLPGVFEPFMQLARTVFGSGDVTKALKGEVFTVASIAAGCRHCQAHGAYGLHLDGASNGRILALWEFGTSPLFSDAERAALRLAQASGVVPNAATAEHFEELRRYFNDRQISELLAVIALGGFLNRYSDTLAVVTDRESAEWACQFLAPAGWHPGKHTGTAEEQRPAFPRLEQK